MFRIGLIAELLFNEELANRLWGTDEAGETWSLLYLMQKIRDVSIDAEELNEVMGRKPNDNWQGMLSI